MKALILAGGRGSRLRPLTHTTNKHLLPIANTPMIVRVLRDAIELGIKEIFININKGDTEIKNLLGTGKEYGVKIEYIEQPEPNGMMYPIHLAEELIGDEEFFFSAGDNILAGGLKKHYEEFKKGKSDAHVLVVKRPDYQQFGVAIVKNGKVVKTVEKPKTFVSDLVLTAIYFFTPVVFKAFDEIKPIDPTGTGKYEYFPPTVINWMIKKGYTMTTSEVTGWWKDTGLPEDILMANQLVLDTEHDNFKRSKKVKVDGKSKLNGDIGIGEGTIIKNSKIRGPVMIGKNVTIEDSYIGPYSSIYNGSEIKNAEIENSVILGGVKIFDVKNRLDNCLIGWNSELSWVDERPRSTSLFIGDNSVVKL